MIKLSTLLIATLLLTFLPATAQRQWTKQDSLWDSFRNDYLDRNFHLTTFTGDIKIELTGNYTAQDTARIDELASELGGILERVRIYRVNSNGNLILNIETLPDSVYEPPIKTGSNRLESKIKDKPKPRESEIFRAMLDSIRLEDIMTRKVELTDYYTSGIWKYYIRLKRRGEEINKGVNRAKVQIQVRQSAPRFIRNKAIQYYLLRELIIPNKSKRIVTGRNDGSILGTTLPLTAQFNEKDSFFLSRAYAHDIYLQLYTRYPKLYVKSILFRLDNLKHRYGRYSLITYFTFSVTIVLFYLLVLIKLNRFTMASKSWKNYMKTGMLIMQSATIMYILYKLYDGRIFNERIPTILGDALVLPNIFNFITLNFFYFSEKLLIRENTTILQRLYFQFFLASLPVFALFVYFHRHTLFLSFVVVYGLLMIIGRLAYTYFNFKTLNAINEKDLEILHFREMQHRAELQALHSRINPHFLYNSLNSIAGLAKVDPEKTEKMALALSEFCRYTINKNNGTFSTVAEEAELAKIYLDIEKTRFGDKLEYQCNISDEARNMTIPRFLIQPLIENAIKHGISQLTGQGIINLVVYMHDNTLRIEVYDNGPAFSNSPTKGYGLQSIYDKLEILYKGQALINWQNEPQKYISVVIPAENKD